MASLGPTVTQVPGRPLPPGNFLEFKVAAAERAASRRSKGMSVSGKARCWKASSAAPAASLSDWPPLPGTVRVRFLMCCARAKGIPSSSTSAVLCFFAARGFLVDFFGILEAPIEFEFCTSEPAGCWANMLRTAKHRPRSRTYALFMILTSTDFHCDCESLPSGCLTSPEDNAKRARLDCLPRAPLCVFVSCLHFRGGAAQKQRWDGTW